MNFKIILNYVYGAGASLQFLAKAAMGLFPLWERIIAANDKDKYLDELEQDAKQFITIDKTKTGNDEKK